MWRLVGIITRFLGVPLRLKSETTTWQHKRAIWQTVMLQASQLSASCLKYGSLDSERALRHLPTCRLRSQGSGFSGAYYACCWFKPKKTVSGMDALSIAIDSRAGDVVVEILTGKPKPNLQGHFHQALMWRLAFIGSRAVFFLLMSSLAGQLGCSLEEGPSPTGVSQD